MRNRRRRVLSVPHRNPHPLLQGGKLFRPIPEYLRDTQLQVKQEQIIDASVAEVGDHPGYDLRPYDSLQTPHDMESLLLLARLQRPRMHHRTWFWR